MCKFLVSLQHESICPFECFGGPGPYAELCKGVVYAAAYYPQPVPHGQWCALNMENVSIGAGRQDFYEESLSFW